MSFAAIGTGLAVSVGGSLINGAISGDGPEAPPPPDYVGAARETAAGNRANSLEALGNNRITQNTPFGSITYTKDKDGHWTQTLSYSPAQQHLLDSQNRSSAAMARALHVYQNQLRRTMANDAGKVGQDALMARYRPQINQDRAALQTQLANQGIMPGSEAYKNAMRTQGEQENDLYRQAGLYGMQAGQQMQNHAMNLLGAARQQSSPTAPQFAPVPQQQYTAGPDILGAVTQGGNYAQGVYNSQVGQYNANGGALGPVGTGALNLTSAYLAGGGKLPSFSGWGSGGSTGGFTQPSALGVNSGSMTW